uniref:Uncharacterized protein n=1 Tax=Vitis vinifera TaxID=29760 RepID=A5B379_VITVI|nr:hypothetical protein VITISV_021780 [Vitis vinifera]
MEIPHEDQSSHYDHEKDKFAYLSIKDRIELGKRQVQQSQWGSTMLAKIEMEVKQRMQSSSGSRPPHLRGTWFTFYHEGLSEIHACYVGKLEE